MYESRLNAKGNLTAYSVKVSCLESGIKLCNNE